MDWKAFGRGMCLVLLLWSTLLPGGTSRAGVVGTESAPRVRPARSIEELRSEIEAGRSAPGGRMFSVSPKALLTELYLPMGRSGLFREFFVLLPLESPLSGTELAEIRNRLAQAGVSEPDRASFRLEDGTVRGSVAGAVVRFSALAGFSTRDVSEDVLLLDPAFLLAVYRNEVKTPIVALAWKLVVTLRERNVRTEEVVLLELPPADDTSLRYGFLPSLLREMIVSPGSFADALPGKWDLLRQAEDSYFFAQYPEAVALYRAYLRENPGDASACYKIAMMAARDLDDDMALQWLNRAAAADPRYTRGFVEVSDYLVRMKQFDPAERILRGGVAASPGDRRLATSLASLLILRGERSRDSGDPEGGAAYFGMAAGVEGADPEVRERANGLLKPEGSRVPATPR